MPLPWLHSSPLALAVAHQFSERPFAELVLELTNSTIEIRVVTRKIAAVSLILNKTNFLVAFWALIKKGTFPEKACNEQTATMYEPFFEFLLGQFLFSLHYAFESTVDSFLFRNLFLVSKQKCRHYKIAFFSLYTDRDMVSI